MPSRKPPLRVLFVSHSAELNGAERMLLLLLQGLDRRAISPRLAVPRPGPLLDEAVRAGVPGIVIPSKWWLTSPGGIWKQPLAWLWNIRSVARLRSLVRKERVGLVVSNSAGNFSGALAARWAGLPHVWSIHEILSGPDRHLSFILGPRLLARLIRRLSRVVLVNSRATGEAFSGMSGIERVPNGLDPGQGLGRPDAVLRKRLGLKKEDKVLGIVGKVIPSKGQLEAIRALAVLGRRRPNLRLLIVGAIADKRYFARLRGAVSVNGLAGRVVFTGRVPDVLAYIRLMDLLLITSRTESFGRTAIEAMAVGTPVLAARVGGLPEIITPGRDGFLVESVRPEVLASAIVRLLDRPGLLRRAAAQGRRTVKSRYNLTGITRDVERILRDAAQPGKADG